MSEDPELKKCPDCAETVRAEARKCRYCGYRFDLRRSAERPSSMTSLFAAIRGTPESQTEFDLLMNWGIELGPGESVRLWLFGHVAMHNGYLVATDQRILFRSLAAHGGGTTVFQHPVSSLRSVQVIARGLRLVGEDYDELVLGLRAQDTGRVPEYLGHVLARRTLD